ncbi:hypothetical protein [Zobellella taiwanensis]|uniref:Integrase n=1 Tax=Zobellella taiwanensis TaxID=347535 RepID=A0A2P7QIM5_9GAMM|nr:hypothetical protein [Zobellella taiwanensis]PSJ37786.1 hypothetical protein C7I36_15120 [Zobellella taiwanensis]
MTEHSSRSHRRRLITQTIAPKKLTKWHRQIVFLRLAQLCAPLLEHFENDLVLFTDSLEQRLHNGAQQPPKVAKELLIAYRHFRKNELLTFAPYAAALCAPWPRIDDNEKYAEWLGVIVLCCCQLHIQGQHDSAISSALREVRLIANDAKHAGIFKQLPVPTSCSSLAELGEQLEVLRQHYTQPNIESAGIGYLSVAVRNAAHLRQGIVRHRRIKVPEFAEPERITPIPLEPVDDSGLEVELLQAIPETPDSQAADEQMKLEPGKTVRVHDSRQRQQTLAMMAQQGQRFAEQLASRQQSLPCSFEQLTEWDIQHLLQYTLEKLEQKDVLAGWVLLALVTGRDPTWLHARAKQWKSLRLIKDWPCVQLHHHVPASQQPDMLEGILPEVSGHFYRSLPIQLYDWVKQFSPSIGPPTASECRAWLKHINKQHLTRLTLGRIVRFMEHWCLNHGIDRVIIALMRAEPHQSRPALSYSHLHQDALVECHYRYVNAIFTMAGQEPGLPAQRQTELYLGSRLHLSESVLGNLFDILASPLKQKRDIWAVHNDYTCYVWTVLAFATGHRDVTAPLGQITDYNPYQRTWWISDKERRHGLAARTLVVPPTAAKQIEHYLEHLRQLQVHCRFLAPELAARCQQALDGSGNLLFILTDKQDAKLPADLTPSLLEGLLQARLPWSRNWARHHLRSELTKRSVNPELIDGWMGHEEIGEEALGRHSFLSMADCREIADVIESIFVNNKIKALTGWTTH